ncbi:ABC transporter ATP-binding protein [Neobacillus mesonae]|nr:ABC transporter ATP-binding protein [Neobacillus mesonae]
MVLNVKNLSVTYGSVQAVDHVSFELMPGKVLGLLGENGAGKSSTISAVLGIEKSNYDLLSILGKSPIKDRKDIFQEVGVQLQSTQFQENITVREACLQWESLYLETAKINELLRIFALEDKTSQLVKSLSGGERQRLAVLLALIPKPKLVFLDELTTGLDTAARRMLWKRLLHMKNEGMAMVLTSHYMDEVETLCDEILILNKGKTVFQGTIPEAVQYSGMTSLEEAYLHFAGTEEENY